MAFKELRSRLDGFYPAKKDERKVGDTVEGRYVEIRHMSDKNGDDNTVYVLETADGKKIGVNAYPVIDSAFAQIKTGTLVHVEFKGLATSKTGREYNDFSVLVDDGE